MVMFTLIYLAFFLYVELNLSVTTTSSSTDNTNCLGISKDCLLTEIGIKVKNVACAIYKKHLVTSIPSGS